MHTVEERLVLLKELKTDFSYQSQVNNAQVKNMVANFDEKGIHTIVVSEREDGALYIVDGQHRVVTLIRLGHNTIKAEVHSGLSIQDEADMYGLLNERKSKSPNARAKARLLAGYATEREVDRIVRENGMQIDYDNQNLKYGYILAYKALERIYKKHGGSLLGLVVNFIKTSFGNDKQYFQGYILEGVAEFLTTYVNDELNIQFLVKRLQEIGFEEFNRETQKYKLTINQLKKCPPYALVDIYNKNKRKENKLNASKLI